MPELEPLLNYHTDEEPGSVPNFGTVVNFPPLTTGTANIKIGDWRLNHPDLKMFVAYGVNAISYPDGKWGLGHGSHIAVVGRGTSRYYWYAAENRYWDELMIPERIIADWDTGEISRQLHFPDLKWFDPYYATGIDPSMSAKELLKEIRRRVDGC